MTHPSPTERILTRRGNPQRLYNELGPALADWILSPEQRAQADPSRSHGPPKLPSARGAALVLFATDDALLQAPTCFPKGFALPFVWAEGRPDHPHLPGDMRDITASVRVVLGGALKRDLSGWGLQPGTGTREAASQDWAKLAHLPLSCSSAWAPLAAALWIAAAGGTPKPNVFATGAWSPQTKTLVAVSGLKAKLQAICALTADHPSTLFVPAANWDDLARDADTPPAITRHAYPAAETSLQRAMAAHLSALELPPDDAQPLQARLDYGNRSWLDRPTRSRYYREHLVAPLARALRESQTLPDARRVVVNLGFAFEQALLTLGALASPSHTEPIDVCVIYTPQSASKLNELRAHAQHLPLRFAPAGLGRFDTPDDAASLVNRVCAWLDDEPEPAARLVDVTGGTSLMSILAHTIARRSQAHAIYIQHRPDDQRAVHYGKEQIISLTRSFA